MSISYADSAVWDRRFEKEGDLDWGGLWTDPFLGVLRDSGCETVLDLGCGTGNDAVRLARAGFRVTGFDFSEKAIGLADSKAIPNTEFIRGDMADELPFSDDRFHAVVSNVALHMFDLPTTHGIVTEVSRILRASGYFIFHVNSAEDRVLRRKRKPVQEELDDGRVLEADGQTVRFFSRDELASLFGRWANIKLTRVEIPHLRTGEPFKSVWRGIVENSHHANNTS